MVNILNNERVFFELKFLDSRISWMVSNIINGMVFMFLIVEIMKFIL